MVPGVEQARLLSALLSPASVSFYCKGGCLSFPSMHLRIPLHIPPPSKSGMGRTPCRTGIQSPKAGVRLPAACGGRWGGWAPVPEGSARSVGELGFLPGRRRPCLERAWSAGAEQPLPSLPQGPFPAGRRGGRGQPRQSRSALQGFLFCNMLPSHSHYLPASQWGADCALAPSGIAQWMCQLVTAPRAPPPCAQRLQCVESCLGEQTLRRTRIFCFLHSSVPYT